MRLLQDLLAQAQQPIRHRDQDQVQGLSRELDTRNREQGFSQVFNQDRHQVINMEPVINRPRLELEVHRTYKEELELERPIRRRL